MALTMTMDVLMVVPDDQTASGLSSLATRNGWPVVQGQSIKQTLRDVLVHNPRVVVVQIGQLLEKTMALIQSLRQIKPGTRVIGAAVEHHELIEQAARIAGVTCYLPDAGDDQLLDQTIESLNATAGRISDDEELDGMGARRLAGPKTPRRGLAARIGAMATALLLGVSSFFGAAEAQATVHTITGLDPFDNSTMDFDDSLGGITTLKIDGVEQIFNGSMTFFYRLGTTGPEAPVGTLNIVNAGVSDVNLFSIMYRDTAVTPRFEILIKYALLSGFPGDGETSIIQQVEVTALSGLPLDTLVDFTLIEYNDLNLSGGTPLNEELDDTIGVNLSQKKVTQQDDSWIYTSNTTSGSIQTNLGNVTFTADQSATISNALADANPTTFVNSPLAVGGPNAGYATQWDFKLKFSNNLSEQAQKQFLVSINKQFTPIPEPRSAMVFLGGVTAFGFAGRRHRRRDQRAAR